MPKGASGIRRGKTPDVTYSVSAEYVQRNGKLKAEVKNDEGFRAILQATAGTRITVRYAGFGDGGTHEYMVRERGGGQKVLEVLNETGQRKKTYVLRSVSDVKKHINPLGAKEITIHGRDMRAEARERRRQEKELMKTLQASWEGRKKSQ